MNNFCKPLHGHMRRAYLAALGFYPGIRRVCVSDDDRPYVDTFEFVDSYGDRLKIGKSTKLVEVARFLALHSTTVVVDTGQSTQMVKTALPLIEDIDADRAALYAAYIRHTLALPDAAALTYSLPDTPYYI